MEQYHGTNQNNAIAISSGQIDVTRGGGELGQGFYTGDLSHEAFNWAWHQYNKDKAVVKLTLKDNDFLNLNPLCLNQYETHIRRRRIRDSGETRTFRFLVNVVWAPVVGKHIPNFNQFKYESDNAEIYLNGLTVIKTIY
ncbi:MAG: hypothetical protein U0V75_10190 [Ferruginibacter sp.]